MSWLGNFTEHVAEHLIPGRTHLDHVKLLEFSLAPRQDIDLLVSNSLHKSTRGSGAQGLGP